MPLSLEEQTISCPYCGEEITLLIDCSVENQVYIEDCQVCCRPINLEVIIDEQNEIILRAWHENE